MNWKFFLTFWGMACYLVVSLFFSAFVADRFDRGSHIIFIVLFTFFISLMLGYIIP